MLLADRMAERVAGRGRQVLYVLLGIIVIAAAGYAIYRWRHKHTEEAEAAMGRAITIARAQISTTPSINPQERVFSTEQERAQSAIEEFQKVAAKYGDPYQTQAKYFIARNQLVTDRDKGLAELQSLSSGTGEVAVLSKFAWPSQRRRLRDEAAALYGEVAKLRARCHSG
jgi:hypothetical protein